MATHSQIEALVRSHMDGDENRFRVTVQQIAALAFDKHPVHTNNLRALVEGGTAVFILPQESRNVLSEVKPRHTLGTLLLSEGNRAQLRDLVREWGAREKLQARGLDARRRVLISGPPGTGKTATAGALAASLKVPLFTARLDRIVESHMGDSSKRLREMFNAVRTTPAVFLLDEFDAVGARRENGGDAAGAEMRRTLNTLLQFLEEEGRGLVVAATNMVSLLDRAAFRRFEIHLEYAMPTHEHVEALVRNTVERAEMATAPGFSMEAVKAAADGLSYAEVETITRNALRVCVLEDSAVVDSVLLIAGLKAAPRIQH